MKWYVSHPWLLKSLNVKTLPSFSTTSPRPSPPPLHLNLTYMNLPIPMDSPPNSPKFPKPALLKVANLKGFWLLKAMDIGDDDQSCSFVNDSSEVFILVISRVFVRERWGIWFGFLGKQLSPLLNLNLVLFLFSKFVSWNECLILC